MSTTADIVRIYIFIFINHLGAIFPVERHMGDICGLYSIAHVDALSIHFFPETKYIDMIQDDLW